MVGIVYWHSLSHIAFKRFTEADCLGDRSLLAAG